MEEIGSTEFCKKLPKLELHAHLNGSLSQRTLKKLYELQKSSNDRGEGDSDRKKEFLIDSNEFGKQSSLEECFKVFDVAHKLTVAPEYVSIAAEDVIEEFYQDNVIYLELRSTPRSVEGIMSKLDYVEAIIAAIIKCETKYPEIMVKLLVSVDRKKGFDDAEENINLAIELAKRHAKYIVGIDLSGDPTTGGAFIDLLNNCRKAGLKIAAHCAEVPNLVEIADILKFKPERLGHCTCIHPNLNGSKELFETLLKSNIPIELCLTSNIKCGTISNYESHQFKYFYEAGHPISISTDDKGVFSTSLSKEYELVGKYFRLRKNQLIDISRSTIFYTFANEEEKSTLKNLFDSMIEQL